MTRICLIINQTTLWTVGSRQELAALGSITEIVRNWETQREEKQRKEKKVTRSFISVYLFNIEWFYVWIFSGSPCSNLSSDIEYPILPAEPGSLLSLVSSDVMPPAQAPAPALTIADVVDPPLPQVTNSSASPMPVTVPTASPQTSASAACAVDLGLCMGSIMVMILLLVGYY